MSKNYNRRSFVKMAGGSSLIGSSYLAGCTSGQNGESSGGNTSNDTAAGAKNNTNDTSGSDSQSQSGHLQVAIQADPQTRLHPHMAQGVQDLNLARNYANTLVRPNPEGEMQPDLAEDWSANEDATKFVFKLRENVTFHPPYDRNLTADDVVENFRRILKSDYGSTDRSNFLGLLGGEEIDPTNTIQKSGEYEVTFELAKPYADFLNSVSEVYILPMDAVDEHGENFGTVGTGTWGTGPFQYSEAANQDHYTFKAFDDYFKTGDGGKSLPYADRLTFNVVPEASVRLTQIKTGKIHVTEGVPALEASDLDSQSGVSVTSRPGVTKASHYLNQINWAPFKKKKVRKALMYAINREAIINVAFDGRAKPGWSVFPPWHWAYSEEATQKYQHDPEKAKQLLQEAGESDLSFPCAVPNQSPFTDIATIVQNNYKKIGVEMEIVPKEKSAVWGPVLNKWDKEPVGPSPENYKSNIETLSVNLSADSLAYWKYHSNHFLNVTYYQQSDGVIEKARQTTDRDKRKRHYATLQKQVTEYVDRIGLVWLDVIQATRSNVQGYTVYPNARILLESVSIQ